MLFCNLNDKWEIKVEYTIQHERQFDYIEVGEGPDLLLLHGLFGALSNWRSVLAKFSPFFKVLIPVMPIYKASEVTPSVSGLCDFIEEFIKFKGLTDFSVIGNSLGGQVGLMLALRKPRFIKTLTLTGSSGLFETGMGSAYPKRGSYDYVKERVEFTFYKPETAEKELVDEVYEIVNDVNKAIRIIKIARAAQKLNMREDVCKIKLPTCLIWGLNDTITPTYVGHEFRRLIKGSELHFIDHCGHAPMMEQPFIFNELMMNFYKKYY